MNRRHFLGFTLAAAAAWIASSRIFEEHEPRLTPIGPPGSRTDHDVLRIESGTFYRMAGTERYTEIIQEDNSELIQPEGTTLITEGS